MSAPTKAFVILAGEGVTVRGPAGGATTIKVRAEDTGGTFALLENLIAPGEGPPLHVHGGEDEMWYILEGHFRFRVDERILDAQAGSFVFVPRGSAHCLQNVSDAPARLMVMFSPAGMERFFEEHAALPAGPVDPAAYLEIARRNGMQVIGPPLAQSDPLSESDQRGSTLPAV
jgi:mannose-6-phosphate isomerase-like protein (cupin superfamily)